MTHRIYLIYDEKAACCVGTFMSLSDEAAKRSFEDLLFNWQPSVYNEHPEDFTLYHLTDFSCGSDTSGTVCIDDTYEPRAILHGSSYSRAFIDNERRKRHDRFFSIATSKSNEDAFRNELLSEFSEEETEKILSFYKMNKEDVSRET